MKAANEIARAVTAPAAGAHPLAMPGRADAPALARRLAVRLAHEWPQRVAWTISRTGRAGLVGIALLLASGVFLVSTHLKVVAEIAELRGDLVARLHAPAAAMAKVVDPVAAMRALPARSDMPQILRQMFDKAATARLTVDSARYQVDATKGDGVVRNQIAFPVTGPYPQIRAFIDATLATIPSVALNDLVLTRKSIGDGNVEAQVRMTIYTRSGP